MDQLKFLLDNNRAWAERMNRNMPDFFARLSRQQTPQYLWIGCADSRVPANEIVGLMPGELFVHRNVANLVAQTDLNCLSVMQFAVDVLKVRHIIVCGHYGCGGVRAALGDSDNGLIDNWLRTIKELAQRCEAGLATLDEQAQVDRMCELNVVQQVYNVCRTTVIQGAWRRQQPLAIHGWIYGLKDGRLRDLGLTVDAPEQALPGYRQVMQEYCG